MGNKFGNFATAEAAIDALKAEGFVDSGRGVFKKNSRTGGNLMAAPRKCTALVEITSYRVDGRFSPDGKDYSVYQHHFL